MSNSYRLAVFGDPVAHSLSPWIHRHFAAQCGLSVDYRAQQVAAADLPAALSDFAAAGGDGLNLTVPHKQSAMNLCASLSERALFAGAVNTLLREASGWRGDNTDGAGLLWDLHDNLNWLSCAPRVVVIGAGGAAAGALAALAQCHYQGTLMVASRSPAPATALAARYPQQVAAVALEHLGLNRGDLIINATSCGHQGQCPDLPAPPLDGRAYDLNYGAAAQPFLDWARAGSLDAVDGLGMLVGQAGEAFELWTGQRPDVAATLRELSRRRTV
ncbi:MAG: shikimate dehydrogenase [Wenzhouxiangellaceae bacterium]